MAKKVLVVDDLGSGALVDLSKYGLPKEPLVQESVKAGADVICFSGDKLISASQAGIIVGKKKHIDLLKNPAPLLPRFPGASPARDRTFASRKLRRKGFPRTSFGKSLASVPSPAILALRAPGGRRRGSTHAHLRRLGQRCDLGLH